MVNTLTIIYNFLPQYNSNVLLITSMIVIVAAKGCRIWSCRIRHSYVLYKPLCKRTTIYCSSKSGPHVKVLSLCVLFSQILSTSQSLGSPAVSLIYMLHNGSVTLNGTTASNLLSHLTAELVGYFLFYPPLITAERKFFLAFLSLANRCIFDSSYIFFMYAQGMQTWHHFQKKASDLLGSFCIFVAKRNQSMISIHNNTDDPLYKIQLDTTFSVWLVVFTGGGNRFMHTWARTQHAHQNQLQRK